MTPLIILAIVAAYAAVVAVIIAFFAAAARADATDIYLAEAVRTALHDDEPEWALRAMGEWGADNNHAQPTATKEPHNHG